METVEALEGVYVFLKKIVFSWFSGFSAEMVFATLRLIFALYMGVS